MVTGRRLLTFLTPTLVPVAALGVPLAQVRWARRGASRLDGPPAGVAGQIGAGDVALRVAWLGDSLAAGVGADHADTTLARLVAQHLTGGQRRVDLHIFAAPGAAIRDVVTDQLGPLSTIGPVDLIVVSAGANDVSARTTIRRCRDSYSELFDALVGTPVVALGVPHLRDALRLPQPLRALAGAQSRRIDQALRAAAAGRGDVTVIDMAAISTKEHRRDLARFLAADRFHPNSDGYQVWAAAIIAALPVNWSNSSSGPSNGHHVSCGHLRET